MATTWKFKQGESHNVYFTIKRNGDPVDVSGTSLSLVVKKHKDDEDAVIEKDDQDFNMTNAASGLVYVRIGSVDTAIDEGIYIGELKVEFADDVDISDDIVIEIIKSGF